MTRTVSLLAAVVACLFPLPVLAAPVAIFHMDETSGTVFDDTGNLNDGTFNGASATDYARDGRFGNALQFRGGQEVNIGNGFDLNDRSFTIETWIKPDAARASQELIASKAEGSTLSNLHLRLGGPGGTWPAPGGLLFGFYSGDLPAHGAGVADAQWQHVAFVFQKNATTPHDRYMYVNGVEVAHDAPSYVYEGTGGNFIIGSWDTSQFLHGLMDEFRVYDHALDVPTIQSHAAGVYETHQPSAIVLAHHSDEAANPVADSSYAGNDGNYGGTAFEAPGRFMHSLGYDGSSATTVAADPTIDFNGEPFTIEMWVNQDPSPSGNQVIVGKRDAPFTASEDMHLRIYDNGSVRMGFYANDLSSGAGVFTPGQWNHLAFVMEPGATNQRYIYLNGVQIAHDTPSSPYLGDGAAIEFGRWYAGGETFRGRIDEPRIYNYALDALTVARHADGQYGEFAPRVPLLVMHMDDTANPIAEATQNYSGDYNGTGFGAPSHLGTSLAFDGNDRVQVASDGVLDFDSRSFTIEMWVKQDPTTSQQVVASKIDEGGTNKNMHLRLYPDGMIRMDWYANSANSATGVFEQGDWHHLAFTYDYDDLLGTGVRRIFYDADIVAEQSAATPYLGTGGDFYIGSWGTSQYFTGLIDEARVYNYALDAGTVLEHSRFLYGEFAPSVPEPATVVLLLLGIGALPLVCPRRKRRPAAR